MKASPILLCLCAIPTAPLLAPAGALAAAARPAPRGSLDLAMTLHAPPFAVAVAGLVPGLGQLSLGDPAGAGIALGAVVVPAVLGWPGLLGPAHVAPSGAEYGIPPVVFGDQPLAESMFLVGAQEAWFVQDFMAYQQANEDLAPQRLVGRRIYSVADLTSAPVQWADFWDWRVWAAVAGSLASDYLIGSIAPDNTPPGKSPFQAKSASYYGLSMPPGAAYGINVVGAGAMGELAGVGEESAWRGVIQDEIEWDTGSPWLAVAATSVLFGLAHVGGINQTSAVKQFVGTAIGGAILGSLYVSTGHDLRKDIAAHSYYDAIGIALNGLQPTIQGNNVFGINYSF